MVSTLTIARAGNHTATNAATTTTDGTPMNTTESCSATPKRNLVISASTATAVMLKMGLRLRMRGEYRMSVKRSLIALRAE